MNSLAAASQGSQKEKLVFPSLQTTQWVEGAESDESLFSSLFSYCENLLILELPDLVNYYRSLIALLLMRKERLCADALCPKKIASLLIKGRVRGLGARCYIQQGYDSLARYLVEDKKNSLEFKQLEKGGVLQDGIPHPVHTGELGLIALYLGLAWRDEELLSQGLKCVEFALSLSDACGKPLSGIWVKESSYCSTLHSEVFSLLFAVAAQLTTHSFLEKYAVNLEKVHCTAPLLFFLKCSFQKLSWPTDRQKIAAHTIDRSLGFLHHRWKKGGVICTAAGRETGVASIYKEKVQVVSIGPHAAPLADPDRYGIVRLSNGSQEGFKDLTMSSTKENSHFRGWTRPVFAREQGRNWGWLFFEMKANRERVELEVRTTSVLEDAPFFFTFFVSADRGWIEKEGDFRPGMLRRFCGKEATTYFERGGETIVIEPHFEGDMQLIPLSGKGHFWSAGFLLAFQLNKKICPYSWTVN